MSHTRRLPVPVAAALAALALATVPGPATAAVLPPPGALVTDGEVSELAASGDRLYARGPFRRVGAYTGPGVAVAAASGALDRSIAPLDGQISDVEPDGRGGWYVGGTFSLVGGQPHPNVAHILADGRVDGAFRGRTDGIVTALAASGGTLWIAGGFGTASGAARRGVAALDAVTGAVLPFDARQAGTATEMAYAPATAGRPARLYVGMRQILALDPVSGDPVPGFSSNINADIRALAVDERRLYVGGSGIAALDPDTGARDPDFRADPRNLSDDPVFSGTVQTLVRDGGRLLAGGQFNALGGQAGPLVALDPATGSADRRFRPQLEPATVRLDADGSPTADTGVFDIVRAGGALWVGGLFTTAGGRPAENLAALDPQSGDRAAPDALPYLGGQVNGLALGAGGRLFVGGNMIIAGSRPVDGIVALDGATLRPDPGFGASDPGGAPMIAGPGGVVFARNDFEGYAVGTRDRYDPTVDTLPVIDGATGRRRPGFEKVRNLSGVAFLGRDVLLARRLSNRLRFPRNLVEVRDPVTGRIRREFVLPLPGYVTGLYPTAAGALYVTGSFRRYRASGRPAHLAVIRVNPLTGALDPTFDPHARGPVYSAAFARGRLFLSGLYDRLGGRRRPGFGAVAPPTGAVDVGFSPSRRLRADQGTRLVGLPRSVLEYFTYDGDGLRVVDPVTGRIQPRAPVGADSVTAVVARPGGSLVAGRRLFASVGGYDSAVLHFIAPLAP